jgi:hypothetical protein
MIQFILLVNKQGQTRVAQYYRYKPLEERVGLETEVVRRCLSVPDSAVRNSRDLVVPPPVRNLIGNMSSVLVP